MSSNGWRNAQASVLAPTGTIGFMMDCDTTGIEPDFSLVKFKKLVGGGSMQIVNQTVPRALRKLGLRRGDRRGDRRVHRRARARDRRARAAAGALRGVRLRDGRAGDQADGPRPDDGGHQPFLSGAISKTVNLPETATVEEIADVYFQGWKLGLKALAVYRDNCKVGQPLSDAKAKKAGGRPRTRRAVRVEYRPIRKRLPKRRPSQTTSFAVGGAEGYLTAGSYPDDGLGEIFLKFGKQGSTLAGVMDAFSIAVSHRACSTACRWRRYVEKFTNMRFEPAGLTDDPDVRMAQSIMDYIFRRLALDYLDFDDPVGDGHPHRRGAGPPAGDRLVRCRWSPATRRRGGAGVAGAVGSSSRSRRRDRARPVPACVRRWWPARRLSAKRPASGRGALLGRTDRGACRAGPPTRRCASPAARRCARPGPATSARAAARTSGCS